MQLRSNVAQGTRGRVTSLPGQVKVMGGRRQTASQISCWHGSQTLSLNILCKYRLIRKVVKYFLMEFVLRQS